MKMPDDCAAALRREFGYVPDEVGGEKWTVYRDEVLIVVHPHNKPRMYPRGARGDYTEIEPYFP